MSRSNKSLFIGAGQAAHTKSVASCSPVDCGGLSRQKRNTQDQQAFCSAGSSLSGVEVNNPGDRHLLSIAY